MKTADDDARYELHLCHCESCRNVRAAIKLNNWQQGMTDAAEIMDLKQAILEARDAKLAAPAQESPLLRGLPADNPPPTSQPPIQEP